ncbi:MAG: nuclear transport factor 2 family protein [Gemmatimonadota bacterium]|nr:MAG: nuclear transport factor 2 family protein [Gemmatimonadota bacterium]
MSIEQNKQFVRKFFERADCGDVGGALELFADDVCWTSVGSTRFSGTYAGKEELVADLVDPLFRELQGGIRHELRNFVAEGDHVVAEVSGRAITRDGRPYNNRYCFVFRLADGRIREVTEYMDTELVTAAFGR